MNDQGFEIRHEENLREHYAMTLAAWSANLDAHWKEAVAGVGPGTARVWRLYMAGSRLGFDRNQIQLHQVLGVRLTDDGHAACRCDPTGRRGRPCGMRPEPGTQPRTQAGTGRPPRRTTRRSPEIRTAAVQVAEHIAALRAEGPLLAGRPSAPGRTPRSLPVPAGGYAIWSGTWATCTAGPPGTLSNSIRPRSAS